MIKPTHLSSEDILLFLDGELTGTAASNAKEHLDTCEKCGRELKILREGSEVYGGYDRALKDDLKPADDRWIPLPPPRLPRRPPNFRREYWLYAAAACAFAIALFYRHSSSADIDDVLSKASEVSAPAHQPLSIEMDGRPLSTASVAHVKLLFERARYDWDEPLNPKSFNTWRHGLHDARNRVTAIQENGKRRFYRVQTDSSSNVLRSAYLLVKAQDYVVSRGGFTFAEEHEVEISRLAPQQENAPIQPPVTQRPQQKEIAVSAEDELRVFVALDAAGVAAEDPIEINLDRERNHVVVSALGLSSERREVLRRSLAALPRTMVRFENSAIAGGQGSSRPAETGQPVSPAIRAALEGRVGGPQAFENLVDRSLDSSHSLFAEAHALAILGREFKPAMEASLSADDRRTISTLFQRRVGAIVVAFRKVRGELEPLITEPLITVSPPGPSDVVTERSWQGQAEQLYQETRNLDGAVSRLSGGSSSERTAEELMGDLAKDLRTVAKLVNELSAHR